MWYRRVLQKNLGECIGTLVHYKSTREAVLPNKILQENWGGCVGTGEYYRSTGATELVE